MRSESAAASVPREPFFRDRFRRRRLPSDSLFAPGSFFFARGFDALRSGVLSPASGSCGGVGERPSTAGSRGGESLAGSAESSMGASVGRGRTSSASGVDAAGEGGAVEEWRAACSAASNSSARSSNCVGDSTRGAFAASLSEDGGAAGAAVAAGALPDASGLRGARHLGQRIRRAIHCSETTITWPQLHLILRGIERSAPRDVGPPRNQPVEPPCEPSREPSA